MVPVLITGEGLGAVGQGVGRDDDDDDEGGEEVVGGMGSGFTVGKD